MSINELQDEVIEEFEAFEDWTSRYQLLIDYANELKKHPMPASDKTQQNLIEGCQSQVWFTAKIEEGRMVLNADSEAVLVRGIVALLLHVLNNHTPQEIAQADLYFVDAIGSTSALRAVTASRLCSSRLSYTRSRISRNNSSAIRSSESSSHICISRIWCARA